MEEKILSVKMKLDDCISQLSEVSWMFSKQPGIYFTRDRKLPRILRSRLVVYIRRNKMPVWS